MKETRHKGLILSGSIYMKCPEQANVWRQKVYCLPGSGKQERGSDENTVQLYSGIVVQCECTKNN